MTQILVNAGSDNDFVALWHQAIIWTNADLSSNVF